MLIQFQDCCHVSTPVQNLNDNGPKSTKVPKLFSGISTSFGLQVHTCQFLQKVTNIQFKVRPVAVVGGAPHSEDSLVEVPLVALHLQLENRSEENVLH